VLRKLQVAGGEWLVAGGWWLGAGGWGRRVWNWNCCGFASFAVFSVKSGIIAILKITVQVWLTSYRQEGEAHPDNQYLLQFTPGQELSGARLRRKICAAARYE